MKSNYYTLGVDPAKHKITVCLLDSGGSQIVAATDIQCTRKGFDQLRSLVDQHVPCAELLVIGVECTASLDDNILALFASMRNERQITLMRVDAAPVHRFCGHKPVRGKSDRADARRIAQFTRTFAGQLAHFLADEQLLAMQRLANERLSLADDITQLKNRLRDRLVISFPELTEVFNDPTCGVALAVLAKAPTAGHITKMRPSTLAQLRGRGSYGHLVGQHRANQLKALAQTSIASACTASDGTTIQRLVSRLEMLFEHQEQIEQHLTQFVQAVQPANIDTGQKTPHPATDPATSTQADLARQIQIAQSLPGMGLVNSCALVLRSAGIRRFTSKKALVAQLGLCPDQNQTGSSRNSSRLTYRGDRRLRALLFLASIVALRTDVAFSFHQWRLVQRGKTPKQAVCACMNRMAGLLWTMINNNTTYDTNRAIQNAIKHHPDLWETYLDQAGELGKTMQKKLTEIQKEVRI